MRAPTPVPERNEIKFKFGGIFIYKLPLSCGCGSFRKGMGAAGFEPATAWSEATYSVQAELSARTNCFQSSNNKGVGLAAVAASLDGHNPPGL